MKNKKGFTIVSAIVGIAISVVGMLAISQMINTGLKGQKGVEHNSELVMFDSAMQQIFGSSPSCTANLSGRTIATNVTTLQPAGNTFQVFLPQDNGSGTIVQGTPFLAVTTFFKGWNVTNLGLRYVSSSGPNTHLVRVVTQFTKRTDAAGAAASYGKNTSTNDGILLTVLTAPPVGFNVTITSCVGTAAPDAVIPTVVLPLPAGNWTVPAGVTRVRARVVGGGGGGASRINTSGFYGGGGGGAGGYCEGIYTVTPGSLILVTLGAGGLAALNSNGGNGTQSAFGALCGASGGFGGLMGTIPTGGNGGTATGGAINFFGASGGDGVRQNDAAGNGGSSVFGGGGRGGSGGGVAGTAPGAGGGGCYGVACAGGAGAPGAVVVEY